MSTSILRLVSLLDTTTPRCWWCAREVDLPLWKQVFFLPLCPTTEREACRSIGSAMRTEAPEEELLDPPSDRPEDLYDCSSCNGHGEVWLGHDPVTAYYEVCRVCQGTGVRQW